MPPCSTPLRSRAALPADLSGKSWTKVEAASPPPARWMHSVTLVKEGAALAVYGGCSANFAPLDDLWIFDVGA